MTCTKIVHVSSTANWNSLLKVSFIDSQLVDLKFDVEHLGVFAQCTAHSITLEVKYV